MTLTTPRPSARLARQQPHITLPERIAQVRRAYFANAAAHSRWQVDVETVVRLSRCDQRSWRGSPEGWIEDLVIVAACLRGDQEAWHAIELANSWRLRQGAQARVAPNRATIEVARFWCDLKRNTKTGSEGPNLHDYCGNGLLSNWLSARMNARIESPVAPSGERFLDRPEPMRTLARVVPGIMPVPTAT